MPTSGYLSLLYSVSKKPLEYWSKHQSPTGRVRKTLDSDLVENVVELQDLQKSSNSNTFITCPAFSKQLLDVRLPFLVIILKNMGVECCFRVQIIDTDENRRHFYFCNEPFQRKTTIRNPVICRVQVKLVQSWNRVEIDLADLTQKAFKSRFKATQRLAICANCRLRRIYFVDRRYKDIEISPELCHAFFEHYLLKRRIQLTQKSSCQKNINTQRARNRAENDSQFFRDLQSKAGRLIDDFFNRINEQRKKHSQDFDKYHDEEVESLPQ